MNLCEKCIHGEVCHLNIDPIFESTEEVKECDHFKPKSRFVELPCEVGSTVYDITEFICGTYAPEMYELKCDEMTIEKGAEGEFNFVYDGMYINCEDIGKTVFLSREKAEKALSERSK